MGLPLYRSDRHALASTAARLEAWRAPRPERVAELVVLGVEELLARRERLLAYAAPGNPARLDRRLREVGAAIALLTAAPDPP